MKKRRMEVSSKYLDCKDWIENLDKIFNKEGEVIYKGRNTVSKFFVGDYCFNVKSFKAPNLINKFVYGYFRASKAERSFLHANRLVELGVNTPEPVGFLEVYKYGFLDRSYYISLQHSYDFIIRDVFNYHVSNREEILDQFVRFTYEKLHKNQVFHLDYSAANVLIKVGNDGTYDFSIVDLNRMKFMPINYQTGLYNLRQLDADNDTLIIMGMSYARLWQKDPDEGARKLIALDQKYKHKRVVKYRYKNFFKKLMFWK